jgi:ABC-type Fe3+/spermidine/putrescine transport system ATPase subunit
MDEPFGALDTHLRNRMQSELRQLHQQLGITVLFVTHDQEEAMILADRIAVIMRGRLQQVGRAEELYEAPANEFVAGFVGESNLLRGTVVSATRGTLRVVTAGGTEFSVAGEASAGRVVTLLIRPESIRLLADESEAARTPGRGRGGGGLGLRYTIGAIQAKRSWCDTHSGRGLVRLSGSRVGVE